MSRWLLLAISAGVIAWLGSRRTPQAPAPSPDADLDPTDAEWAHREARLDEALDESFPASDSPAMTISR